MLKSIFEGTKVKFISGLLALSIVASGTFVALIPTESNATTLHPTGALMEEEVPSFCSPAATIYNYNLPENYDMSFYYPEVGNQESQGSCVAFATGYAALTYKKAYEVDFNRTNNRYAYYQDANNIFSPSFIYNQIHVDYSPGGGGTYVSEAMDLLRNQGCATLAEMPYNGSVYNYYTQPTTAQLQSASKNKIYSWEYISSGNVNQMKIRLAENTPIVIVIPTYPDFDSLSKYNEIYDVVEDTDRGLHAVCLVGYSDEKQAFKLINSWGTDWGVDGYGWISYDLIEDLSTTGYTFPVAPGNFRMTNGCGLDIQYSWDRIANSRYAIYRKPTESTEEFTKFLETGTNNVVSIVTPIGSYDYCVAIVDGNGNRLSGYSRISTAERFESAPTNFRATNSAGLLVQFKWTSVQDKTYAIYRRPTGSNEVPTKVIETGTNNVQTITTLLGDYDYCVAFVDSNGNRTSYFSNFVKISK